MGIGSNNPVEAANIQREFAQWMLQQDQRPTYDAADDLKFGDTYARAMRRLNRRGVIDPTKMERPLHDDGWFRLWFQMQGFNYGYQRNVIDAQIRTWKHAYEHDYQYSKATGKGGFRSRFAGARNWAWAAGAFGGIAAGAIMSGMITSAFRAMLLDRKNFDKHLKEGTLTDWLRDLAYSRSGLTGTPDPYIQMAANVRYLSDINNIFQGPSLKWIGKNSTDVLRGFYPGATETADQTNTRIYNATRGAYNMIMVPAAAFAAAKLGGFGLTIPSAILAQTATSADASDAFAAMLAGPQGTELPKEQGGGLASNQSLTGLSALHSLGETEKPEEGSAGTSVGVPWGLLDDIAIPAWRGVSPIVSKLPRTVKLGAAGAVTAYAGEKYLEATAPYRDAASQGKIKDDQEDLEYRH